MKIDLCKVFGVEEGEEFKIELSNEINENTYRIIDNKIEFESSSNKRWWESHFLLNNINRIEKVIKLPKKKQFIDDELCILKNIESEFNVLGKNINGTIYVTSDCEKTYLKPFNNLFQSLDVGEEIRIDDYVDR